MELKNKTPEQVTTSLAKKLPEFELPTEITSMEEYQMATDLGSQISSARKEIEKYRDFFAKPHYKVYKEIRKKFEPFIKDLEAKEKKMKSVMLAWHKEEQKRRDEEQARIEAEAIANAEEGQEVSVEVVNDIKTVEGGAGKSQVRTLKKWRVKDITLVPSDYLEVNKSMMNEAVKKGIVPSGIEVYEEETMAFSR